MFTGTAMPNFCTSQGPLPATNAEAWRSAAFCSTALTVCLWPQPIRQPQDIATVLVSTCRSQPEPWNPTVLVVHMTKTSACAGLKQVTRCSESFQDSAFHLKLISQLWKRKKTHQAELRAQHVAKHTQGHINLTIHHGHGGNLGETRRAPSGPLPSESALLELDLPHLACRYLCYRWLIWISHPNSRCCRRETSASTAKLFQTFASEENKHLFLSID